MIDFTRERYEQVINNERRWDDGIGCTDIGAVSVQLIFREDDDESFLVVDFYLLGKDDHYGEVNGVPYSYEEGFYATICDTYEETLAKLEKDVEEFIASNKDLANGAKETELTWEKVRVN